MARTALTDEERIDRFLDTATKDQLIRLHSDVSAALRWKFGVNGTPAPTKRPRKAKNWQENLPLEAK